MAVRPWSAQSNWRSPRFQGYDVPDAGEFTRRALMNGKLDLSQVEGIGDLLAAETAAQARQAFALVDGALSGKAARWRECLVTRARDDRSHD